MPFKTYTLLEQAKVAVKDAARENGGMLGVGADSMLVGPRCALSAMVGAVVTERNTGGYNVACDHYGLVSDEAKRIWLTNDRSKGNPEAVLRVLDEIGVG